MKTEAETRVIEMSYDNFENAIVSFLYSIGALNDNEDVIASDFGVELNENGNVEFDLEIVKHYEG